MYNTNKLDYIISALLIFIFVIFHTSKKVKEVVWETWKKDLGTQLFSFLQINSPDILTLSKLYKNLLETFLRTTSSFVTLFTRCFLIITFYQSLLQNTACN